MSPTGPRWLYWTPRVLAILFAVFISLFALDVFGEHYPPGQLLVALGMHLLPTAVVLVVLAIAWRWELIGALAYVGLGAFYIAWSRGRVDWTACLAIAGPPFVVGVLFLSSWLTRRAPASRNGPRVPRVY